MRGQTHLCRESFYPQPRLFILQGGYLYFAERMSHVPKGKKIQPPVRIDNARICKVLDSPSPAQVLPMNLHSPNEIFHANTAFLLPQQSALSGITL